MCRQIGILLLAAVLAPSALALVPSTATPSGQNLPACCRRDGKHHCAVAVQPAPQDTRITAEAPACPFQSTPSAISKTVKIVAPGPHLVIAAAFSGHTVTPDADTPYGLSAADSHLKRGPPMVR